MVLTAGQLNKFQALTAAPLKDLFVCSDCEVAMNQNQCPYCLSGNTAPLVTWLNRANLHETTTQQEKPTLSWGGESDYPRNRTDEPFQENENGGGI